MKFIINPLNGTKHSLFSKQGKNLLKSYVKTYQTGGAAIIDQTDILHILGCMPEILQFDEAENRTGRMDDSKSTKPIALLSEQCSDRTLSKDGKYPLMPESTRINLKKICNDHEYGGALKYHPHEGICLNADTGIADRNVSKLKKQIWKDIFKSLNNIFENIEEKEGAHVVIVSHHNLIKKVLLGIPKKKGIANCACIEIRINRQQPQEKPETTSNQQPQPQSRVDGSIDEYEQTFPQAGGEVTMRTRGKTEPITFHFIFTGYPDKKKYDYLNKLNTQTKDRNWAEVDTTNIKNELERHGNLPNNFSIYLVRHGNAMHNKPMMDMLQKKHTKFYRPLDSSLTLLGLWQAKQLGNALKTHFPKDTQIVYCASNLSRAQTTALAIKEVVDEFTHAPRLKTHYEQKKEESLERMTRRLKINSKNQGDIIEKLAESLNKMLESSGIKADVEDFKSTAVKMLGEFLRKKEVQIMKDNKQQQRKKQQSILERDLHLETKQFNKRQHKQRDEAKAAAEADAVARSDDEEEDRDDFLSYSSDEEEEEAASTTAPALAASPNALASGALPNAEGAPEEDDGIDLFESPVSPVSSEDIDLDLIQ
jgi:broad specificity phosphatase PhoE